MESQRTLLKLLINQCMDMMNEGEEEEKEEEEEEAGVKEAGENEAGEKEAGQEEDATTITQQPGQQKKKRRKMQ